MTVFGWGTSGFLSTPPEPTGPIVFISGPISGMPDGNRAAFQNARGRLRGANFRVEDPSQTKGEKGWTWSDYMRRSLKQLLRSDVVAVLPGWNYSKGAQVEVALANELGIPVMMLDELLLEGLIDHG